MADMMPAGLYKVRACGQAFSETSKKNPQFELRFFILGRYDIERPDGHLIPCGNEQRTYFRAITEKTVDFFIEDMRALGWEGRSFQELDPEFESPHLFACEFDAICKHDSYEGKPKEEWMICRPRQTTPLEKKTLRGLDALYGAKLRETAKARPPVAAAAAASNQDLPF